MSAKFQRIKGFADLYGESLGIFSQMEDKAREIFPRYAFKEIRVPILEFTDLFQRSIGTETDVVEKEMFTFPDRKGRMLTMRPEATAGVMRASIEAGLAQPGTISRLYTIGPMFRYERPQKGRMRQFHQINCECLGSASPYADAELILMLLEFLASLGLVGLRLKINSLGCRECRPEYMRKLREFLGSLDVDKLCVDCARRMAVNPMRVLDCKQEGCAELAANAPRLLENICSDCQRHHEKIMELLAAENVPVEIDHHLVRGLDYYSRTTFEVVSGDIGAQTAVAGGGRYDGLIAQLGGADVPGVGFACGMERLALLMKAQRPARLDFYMVAIENDGLDKAFLLAENLRKAGLSGEINYGGAGFKSLMRQASKSGAAFCLILGSDEIKDGEITIKNMDTGEQWRAPQSAVAPKLKEALEQ